MGASTSFLRFPDSQTRKVIESNWAECVEQSRFECGNSYSGEIGMLGTQIAKWHDLNFPTAKGAYDYIETNHKKWNHGIAVSCQFDGAKWWIIGGWCSS